MNIKSNLSSLSSINSISSSSSSNNNNNNNNNTNNNDNDNDDNIVSFPLLIYDIKTTIICRASADDSLWTLKRNILLTNETANFKDGLNYGFYTPASDGRIGKFLDENHRKTFMGAINSNSNKLNDVIKMLKKGHDPNYQDAKTGETPMTSAILSKCSTDLLLHLVSEGAHLDYRNSRGDTPLHVAAVSGNVVALKTVLDLGASPNSRSSDNLTPLHQLCRARDVELANYCVQMLLENYSVVDVADQAGNTELHHSCRLGRLHITRKLIVYGANINRQNETGNTPLHELIARKLLAYGAQKDINNHSNLDAYGSAVTISSDYLAEYIANFKPSDICE
ncbi:hypothetical protein HELRODRAFT_180582 [Helobdella robusta]|uniref:Uncharacterized protein n=1 Tax=Helobdella robusta TaxID=6412 RepID=T1FG26_HELRO|nr:hypothetical protein HELRODRAFT_180582 [Helobdella robusta]ESN93718.1 hypothetical protein HELRODRAFT_180582 [Helobdella robusta]